MVNPFQPPSDSVDVLSEFVKCPKCGASAPSKVSYTWWGGFLGPKLFNVVRCHRCAKQYNGRTGASLTGVIIVYQLVLLAIVVVLLGAYYALR